MRVRRPVGHDQLGRLDADDPAGSLTLSATSSNQALVPDGNLVLAGSGARRALTATATPRATGTATITITVSDGSRTTSVTVALHAGGNGADTLAGPRLRLLLGQNGNDALSGRAGHDLLCGGRGDDTLNGGDGDDSMSGGQGGDRFSGGSGADTAPDFSPSQGDTQDGT